MRYLLAVLLLSAAAFGQSTTVTATVHDINNTAYSNASITANFVNPSNLIANWNGFPLQATTWTAGANSVGFFSMVLPDLNFIAPATGTYYSFTICYTAPPTLGQPTTPCFVYVSPACPTAGCVTGSSIDLSAVINALPPPPIPTSGGGGGGSGNVSIPGCNGNPVTYYPNGFVASVQGDCFFTTNNGNIFFKSGTATDTSHAGAINMLNGPTPVPLNLANGTQEYAAANSGASSEWVNCNVNNIRYAQCFNWVQSPASPTSISSGANTVTLSPCPMGVDTSNNTNAPYYVYLATGTAEAVRVTGGTCAPGALSGTIIFTAQNTHAAGYTVQSASGGIKEAIDDAGSPNSRVVISPTGANANAIQVYAPIFLNKNKIELSAEGAHVQCSTRSRCLMVGDTVNSNDFGQIRIRGLRLESLVNVDGVHVTNVSRTSNVTSVTVSAADNFSMTGNAGDPDVVWLEYYPVSANINEYIGYCTLASVVDSTHFTCTGQTGSDFSSSSVWGSTALANAAIEDNAMGTVLEDVVLRAVGSSQQVNAPWFHNFLVFDNDQAAKVYNLDTDSTGVRCDSNFCGNIIFGRSDSGNASVLSVTKANISLQCDGNGILQRSGNTLSVSDSVVQGYAQYGIKNTNGLQNAAIFNVYEEVGGCTNPYYPGSLQAETGFMSGGAYISGSAPSLSGSIPTFANTGATERNYYIVATSTGSAGPMMLAGIATTNGSGTVNVYWPQIPSGNGAGAYTYDVLITSGPISVGVGPYLGNATSIATGLTSSACTNGICTFADTLGAGSAYSYAGQGLLPDVEFWPGTVVFSVFQNYLNLSGGGYNYVPIVSDKPYQFTSVFGQIAVGMVSPTGCDLTASDSWVMCDATGPTSNVAAQATVFQQVDGANNGPGQNISRKGRLIFQHGGSQGPFDILTMVDCNTNKTIATAGFRPASDNCDSAIGNDASNTAANAGLSYGAPISQSWYIGTARDGSSWKARLTGSLWKQIVASQITETTFSGLPTCNAGAAGTYRPISDSTVNAPGAVMAGSGSVHAWAYCDGSNWIVAAANWSSGAIPNGVTGTTQAANSNDTKLATDAYADRVIANPLFTGNTSENIVRVTSNFSSASASQTAITGLSWTLPANLAATYHMDCTIVGSQATSATALTWSVNDVTVAPTAGSVSGYLMTNGATTVTPGTGVTYTTTGSKTVVSATPASINAFIVILRATWEQPSNGSTSVFQVELGVAGGANTVTINRDAAVCKLGVTAN